MSISRLVLENPRRRKVISREVTLEGNNKDESENLHPSITTPNNGTLVQCEYDSDKSI